MTNALGMALEARSPEPGTILHSDHGTQFASWAFTTRARDSGLLASMGSIGDCFDNEIFHNRQRRHSALGMRTPVEYGKLSGTVNPAA